jgi:hypothetical protein
MELLDQAHGTLLLLVGAFADAENSTTPPEQQPCIASGSSLSAARGVKDTIEIAAGYLDLPGDSPLAMGAAGIRRKLFEAWELVAVAAHALVTLPDAEGVSACPVSHYPQRGAFNAAARVLKTAKDKGAALCKKAERAEAKAAA